MRQKLASIAQWLSTPTVCSLCHHTHHEPIAICAYCRRLLSRIENPCQTCRRPLPSKDFLRCGDCIRTPPAFDRVISEYCFEEPLRTLLHDFKYQHALHLRTFLMELMLEALDEQTLLADCIMPIPLHRKRIQARGFNQAAELAKGLSRRINIPYDSTVCRKITNTSPQVGLSAAARRNNLRHTFAANASPYRYVLLVDDLITTGSTANAMALVLKNQGVHRVDIWCCARAT